MILSEQPNAPYLDAVVAYAYLGDAELVTAEHAIGRVSCESIAGCPPAIPSLLSGESTSAEIVDYVRALTASGARLHGASDPTINVLRER
jgi:arginine decarboxylase